MKKEIIAYVCDDKAEATEKITNTVTAFFEGKRECRIETFSSGEELAERWKKLFADVVFLDIDMPGMNGFEVAEKLRENKKNAIIIFVTSYEDKVFQSYEYQPFWFVRKSHFEDIKTALSRVLKKIDFEYDGENTKCNLVTQGCVVEIDLNNISIIESYRHDIILKDRNGTEKQFRCKISDAEKQLEKYNIIRVQNGVLVNCRFISKVTSREVVLHNEEKISIGRKRVDEVKKRFQSYVRDIL